MPGPGIVVAGWNLVAVDACSAAIVGSPVDGRGVKDLASDVFRERPSLPPELEATLRGFAERLFALENSLLRR